MSVIVWVLMGFFAYLGWMLAKALAWLLIAAILVGLLIIAVACTAIPRLRRQARCEHKRIYETRACDAICCDCGKDLGFIGGIPNRREREV